MTKKRYFSVMFLAVLASGCASMVVKDEDIVKKTAFALSLDRSDFTISNRADDGLQTTYTATTKSGKKYNCYVEGSFSFGTGSVVTDAICNEVGAKNGGTSCNALLKKAGKC